MRTKLMLLALGALAVVFMAASSASARSAGTQVPLAGTGSAQTGAFTPSNGVVGDEEFAGESDGDEGPGAYAGSIVNRSLSQGAGGGAS